MAKVLLVEDDNNLREIFEMRLQAEGYQTSVAGNGEEALAVAVKEKPDLIIADVMMPKMSGFEMLETLRETPDMASTKVVMMTALGQAEDRVRGEKLGVVKYLVKSQVTLEDFVRTVKEVLQAGSPSGTTATPQPSGEVASNNNVNNINESEKKMDDSMMSNNNPAPADNAGGGAPMPASDGMSGGMGSADNGMGATPAAPTAPTDASAPMPSSNPISDDAGQMSMSDQQSAVDSQVSDAMGATPAAPVAGDVPMGTPPADNAGGDTPMPPSDQGSMPA